MLLWAADLLCRPSFRLAIESFETWTHRKGLDDQLGRLRRQGLVEVCPAPAEDRSKVIRRLYRLTSKGLLDSLGGRLPPDRWARPWDGLWRMAVFDVPEPEAKARRRLRRLLRSLGFGYLQKSGWITPDPLDLILRKLSREGADVKCFFTLEGRPAAGEPDQNIVRGAWDFDHINQLYEECLHVLEKLPRCGTCSHGQRTLLLDWGRREQSVWLAAVSSDPLLPDRLLPPDYLGKKAWEQRVKTLAQAGLQI